MIQHKPTYCVIQPCRLLAEVVEAESTTSIEADGFWHVEQLLVSHPWEYLENLESLENIVEVKIKDVAIEVTEIKFSRKSIKKVFSRFQAMFPCTPSVIKSEKYRQKTYKTGWPCQK